MAIGGCDEVSVMWTVDPPGGGGSPDCCFLLRDVRRLLDQATKYDKGDRLERIRDGGARSTHASIASRGNEHPAWLHPLAVTGLLGAFTTFSTFALDTQKLFSASPALAILNIAASVIGSIVAIRLGFKMCGQ